MFSTLRTRFGIPGVISVIALVFALIGGAYAANNSGSAGKATASAKAKKGPRGPKGATGPAGPAGPQGPAGPAGPKGDTGTAGTAGTNGTNGTNGTDGKSAEATSFAGNQHGCTEGGIEVKSAKPTTFVCNGVKGTNGTTGFTETLPPGKTETGAWAVNGPPTEEVTHAYSTLSFNVPVTPPASGAATHWLDKSETNTEAGTGGCTGSVEEPTAPAGVLCIYTKTEGHTTFVTPRATGLSSLVGPHWSRSGALLDVEIEGEEGEPPQYFFGYGSYAITAPTS